MDNHESSTPGQAADSDPPAKVPRRYVGSPARAAPPPDRKPGYKPDPSWDKLLLVVGAAVIVVALLVVPGILNRGGQNPVAAAAEATSNASRVRISFTASSQGPLEINMSGRGLMNGETKRASLELSATGSGTSGAQSFSLDEVVDDGDIYFHSPELGGVLGASKPWLLMRAEVFGDLFQGSSNGVGAGMSASPTQQLDALKDASYQVSEGARERVSGVDTTHYTALIDVGKLTDELKSHVSGELGDLIEKSAEQVSSETVDVWIDGQGLVRRETSSLAMGSVGNFTMTMDFSHYGIHPDIAVPAPAQVYDVTPVLQGALDQLGS